MKTQPSEFNEWSVCVHGASAAAALQFAIRSK